MNKKFQEKLELLKEQRQIEALKEQICLKASTIARVLGQPIVHQLHNPFYDNDDPNPYDIHQLEDFSTSTIGYYFSGLKSCVNLNINTEIVESKPIKISVEYNGYIVLLEEEGELLSYAPFDPWFSVKNGKGEGYLISFYEMAVQKEKQLISQNTKERKNKSNKIYNDHYTIVPIDQMNLIFTESKIIINSA